MANKFACVLDIGSGKINAMVGERGINGALFIKGTGEVEYDGFCDGDFLDVENLRTSIQEAIRNAEHNSGVKVKKIYVGVPSEFSYCINSEATVAFNKRKKIKDEDVINLFNQAAKFESEQNVIISRSPIYFLLDDNRKSMDPKGLVSTKLSGKISFVLAEKKFVELLNSILQETGIINVEYVSGILAESLYLIDPEIRDFGAILVDVGYISTSVAVIKGDGLLSLNAFSVGGGHITADLNQCLGLTFNQAESLKRKVVLSLDAGDNDFYEVNINGNVTPISAKLTNEIVSARLDMFASLINKCLNASKNEFPNFLPIHLTGGGICYLKGGKDYLSKVIGRNIEVVTAPIPQLNRPHFSSVLGLMNLALRQELENNKGIIKKFLNLFKN